MEVNLNQMFRGFKDKPIRDERTIGDNLAEALFVGQGVGNKPEEKFAAYKLLNKIINASGPVELDIDERKMIKSVACASLIPGAYGQIVELLKLEEVK